MVLVFWHDDFERPWRETSFPGPDRKSREAREIDGQAVKKGDVGMGWEEDDDKSGSCEIPPGSRKYAR